MSAISILYCLSKHMFNWCVIWISVFLLKTNNFRTDPLNLYYGALTGIFINELENNGYKEMLYSLSLSLSRASEQEPHH